MSGAACGEREVGRGQKGIPSAGPGPWSGVGILVFVQQEAIRGLQVGECHMQLGFRKVMLALVRLTPRVQVERAWSSSGWEQTRQSLLMRWADRMRGERRMEDGAPRLQGKLCSSREAETPGPWVWGGPEPDLAAYVNCLL